VILLYSLRESGPYLNGITQRHHLWLRLSLGLSLRRRWGSVIITDHIPALFTPIPLLLSDILHLLVFPFSHILHLLVILLST
jgi:hypothetical protein